MKRRLFKSFFKVCILFIFVSISFHSSWGAEKYPSRQIEIVTGFPPGGMADLINRSWARHLSKVLGVTVVPVNKPGGGGTVATIYVGNSRPDGYTLLNVGDSFYLNVLLGLATYKLEDFRIVAHFGSSYTVLAVLVDSPWKTFQEFMDYVRKNPDVVTYGHSGASTTPTIRMVNLLKCANLKMVGVPFKGDAELVPALLGKHVPIAVFNLAAAKPLVDGGKFRILFSFDPPAEMGLDPSIPDWSALFGKGEIIDVGFSSYLIVARETPDEIVKVLERAMEEITRDPEFIRDFKSTYQRVNFIDGKTFTEKISPGKISRYKEILREVGLIK